MDLPGEQIAQAQQRALVGIQERRERGIAIQRLSSCRHCPLNAVAAEKGWHRCAVRITVDRVLG
ncbi:hypothetical protein GCM10009734_86070 [Nonomuraea bangladeshensis]